MTHKDKALSLFSQGFHCSQAVLGAFAEELGMSDELALSVSGSFGGGMRNGEVCGACTGALMAIGLKYKFFKADDIGSKEKNNAVTSEFLKRFKEKNGSCLCRELLGYDLSDPKQQAEAREKGMFSEFCPKMVASAVETAEELMNE
ncbi:C-GCAxxG-C-C family protein [Ruminococcus albus]|uniref:C_GCAxxG_C_C family probable redox protein n=1 Tax=Ruminococcus albus TaxID=1264 RepID=A0A1H7FHU1_RUMAL|nr:C-GCAxxG-C-C family protein [Ruminococcus albus]SEK24807.1 C_GCAxxG_C_C family probable redox protein [Ruminococcus albus]